MERTRQEYKPQASAQTREERITETENVFRYSHIQDIIARLDTATPEECNVIRRMLGLPEHEKKSCVGKIGKVLYFPSKDQNGVTITENNGKRR